MYAIVCLFHCLLFFILICVYYCIDVVADEINSIQFNSKLPRKFQNNQSMWDCSPNTDVEKSNKTFED